MGQVVPINATADVHLVPPQNRQAEQALLAAILVNNRCFEQVGDFLRPEHFFDPTHARLFLACEEMIAAGHKANVITIRPYLSADPDAEELGGAGYAQELVGALVSTDVVDYGRAIHEAWQRRCLIEVGEDLVRAAYGPPQAGDAPALAERHGARVFETINGAEQGTGLQSFAAMVTRAQETAQRAHQNRGKVTGLSTGFIDLDHRLAGLHPSDLIILAGRPSMGKTALAAQIAFNAARSGTPVGFWSLEMSGDQIANRLVAAYSNVSSHDIRRGAVADWDFGRYIEAGIELADLPLWTDGTGGLHIDQLRMRARTAKRLRNIGLVVVDYLQLLRSGTGGKQSNRTQEITEITGGLKAIAKELDVPVLALSQLSRQVEQRDDKRPQLSDLRESGSIEQDADVVAFIYREEYYLQRAEPGRRPDESAEKYSDRTTRWNEQLAQCKGLAEVIIAKQRHGPIGTENLHFDEALVRFSNHDPRRNS